MSNIRVAIIDDEKSYRDYLESEIRKLSPSNIYFDFAVENLAQLKEKMLDVATREYAPDILLVDMNLSTGMGGGIKIIQELHKRRGINPKVLIISAKCDEFMAGLMKDEYYDKGVRGCITKSVINTRQITSLKNILIDTYENDDFIKILPPNPNMPKNNVGAATIKLTEKHKTLLNLLATGKTQREIAHSLGKAEGGIYATINTLKKKFQVKSLGQLILAAQRLGVV